MSDGSDKVAGSGAGVTRIGPYKVLGVLGQGGMGVVYLAEQEEPVRRRVALKVLSSGRGTERGIARMEAERQALALMNHPSIATVYDAGTTDDGLPYFAMEVVDGAPIIDFCERARLGIDERLQLFVQVCEAVAHAHQKMVIHRDLKPTNVLVTMEDGRPVPKLIDFGIAKCLERPLVEHESLETRDGLPLGTPMYMSPEQIERGALDLDARTDVYALGILLYELVVGVLPLSLDEADPVQIMIRVLKVEYPRMSARFERLSRLRMEAVAAARSTSVSALHRVLASDIEWIAMKAVEKDRGRRYGSAAELRADIIRYRGSKPVHARAPSSRYRVGRFLRRYRMVVASGTLVLAALAVGLVISTVSLAKMTRARDEARLAESRATTTVEYLRKVLASVDPGVDGRQVRVVDMLQKASSMIPTDLENEPLVEASVRKTIGMTLLELGLFEEAGEQLEQAVRTQTLELGADDPETLHTINAVGRQLYKLGQYERAAGIHRSVLDQQVEILGPTNSTTLWTRYHLAKALHRQGRWLAADSLYREVIRIRKETLGPRHLDTLIALSSMGQFLAHRGHFSGAEKILSAAITDLGDTVGTEHPDTLRARINFIELLNLWGRHAEADEACQLVLPEASKVLGQEHPETLTLIDQQALAAVALGHPEEALVLSQKVLTERLEKLGDQHPDVLGSVVLVAACRVYLGPIEKAEEQLLLALDRARDGLPPGSWQMAQLELRAGQALMKAGRFAISEPLLVHSYEISVRDDSGSKAMAAQSLVELYESWGRDNLADRFRE